MIFILSLILRKVLTGFPLSFLVKHIQVFSKFFPSVRNFRTVQNPAKTVQLSKALYIKYCSNFIVQKNQMNRSKFVFNRSKRKTDTPRVRMSAKLSYPDYGQSAKHKTFVLIRQNALYSK